MNVFWVSSQSRPASVARAIAFALRETSLVELQAMGPRAVNQAIKAVTIAHKYLQNDGIDTVCVPQTSEAQIDGQPRTIVKLIVKRHLTPAETSAS